MTDKIYSQLKQQLKNSYSPYSKFKTAAAIETDKGLFFGNNIENASYSATVCAERAAIFNAQVHGSKKFKKLYLISSSKKDDVIPCAVCLQVMSEFFDANASVIVYSFVGKKTIYKFSDLLPVSFSKKELDNAKK